MHPVLKRSFIFVLLLIAGVVIYAIWFGVNAKRYDDSALPYLDRILPQVTSWNYAQLQPLLSPQARAEFETEKGQQSFRLFSRVGALQSYEKPQYVANRSSTSEGLGDINLVSYSVLALFDTGPATIKISLASDGEQYYLHHLRINSAVFKEFAD